MFLLISYIFISLSLIFLHQNPDIAMSALIIDGKKIAEEIRSEVKESALRLKTRTGIVPGLAFHSCRRKPGIAIVREKQRESVRRIGLLFCYGKSARVDFRS